MSLPISGFTAVPNPQMLAFMAAQSFIMMYQAGEGWQYGKRKQSAMSNEDFNKQTPLTIMQNQAATLRAALPTIVKSMNDMTPLIGDIVKQYGDFIKEIIRVSPEIAQILLAPPAGGGFPGTGDKAIAKFFEDLTKNLPNILPEAHAEQTVVVTHPETKHEHDILVGDEQTPGSDVFPPKGTVIHDIPPRGFTPPSGGVLGGPAPISKPSDIAFQPGAGTTQQKINQLKSQITANLAQQNRVRATLNTSGRLSRDEYLAIIAKLNQLKSDLGVMEHTLTLLKVKLATSAFLRR